MEAYNDLQGLLLTDGLGTATVEGGERQSLDARGKAALATALPQNWVKVARDGFTPVWRSAGLTVAGIQAVVDARLTPLADPQTADGAGLTLDFGHQAMQVTLPAGALAQATQVSLTPLSSQGLPGLLPMGWSALSAWWFDAAGQTLAVPALAALELSRSLSGTSVPLPGDAALAWTRWEPTQHAWVVLAAQLAPSTLTNLALPGTGGYALVLADPGGPAPVAGSILPGLGDLGWRDGVLASGSISPSMLPTVEAINGARGTAAFNLSFQGQSPLASGTLIQTDVLESYTLVDESSIEPDGFSQDTVASRWLLEVADGRPVLTGVADGLALRVPVRMSRTFDPSQLVEGRILVGFYHDGVKLAEEGSGLIGAGGGTLSRDGVTLNLGPGAVTGTTLVRLATDHGDLAALWPEVSSEKGDLKASFQVEVVGTLRSGLGISMELQNLPAGARPLLLQRRTIQGQALVAAVGELRQEGSSWILKPVPPGGNPILSGGAFAVLVPSVLWDWIGGTALLPATLAQPLQQRLGARAGLKALANPQAPAKARTGKTAAAKGSTRKPALAKQAQAAPDSFVTVADVSVDAGLLLAISGPAGTFSVPAAMLVDGGLASVKGSRYDLGLTGTSSASVPSSGTLLNLDVRPFAIETLTPEEGAEGSSGQVIILATTTAMDSASLPGLHLYQVPTLPDPPLEVGLRRSLSQDGRTLFLTPEAPLALGAQFRLVVSNLLGISGGAPVETERHFHTAAIPLLADVDLSKIQVSYPDDQLNITVTIPALAIPSWSMVEVVSDEMGSIGSGIMPPAGELGFQMKAALGQRLTVTVQTRDGRRVRGTIGRYVAADGRTTLGVDGGRVEGPNGLAIRVLSGALTGPVELRVEALPELPPLAEGTLLNGEQAVPGLRIVSKEPLTFQVPPIIEVPASVLPEGVDLAPRSDGNGPLALFQKVSQTLPDGTEDVFNVLMDTARLSADGTRIVSMGGLRIPEPDGVSSLLKAPVPMSLAKGAAPVFPAQKARTGGAKEPFQAPGQAMPARKGGSIETYGLMDALLDVFLLGMDPAVSQDYKYHSGTVYRNWNGSGSCGGAASAACYGYLAGAEVYRYRGTTGLSEATKGRLARGRMLARCDEKGRYMNLGGPDAGGVFPGQSWIALFAVDPRTGETSIDAGSPSASSLGLPFTRRDHSIAITSLGGNPFDPTLSAPRIRAQMLDGNQVVRSVFANGDRATLRITTETGSQAVIRGKVTGSLETDFGLLPTELPVTFTREGSWHVDVTGWTSKPIQGLTSLEVMVTSSTLLGPALPGAPRIVSRDPRPGDSTVDPSAPIKVLFSEPILPLKAGFEVKVNNTAVPFTLYSNGQALDGAKPAQEVWLVPNQRLCLGATVAVTLQGLLDLDATPSVLAADTWSFTVRGADTLGTMEGAGLYATLALNKGTLYAVEKSDKLNLDGMPMQSIRMIDVSDPALPKAGKAFGAHGSWDPQGALYKNGWAGYEPFYRHELNGLKVAESVTLKGKQRDLLLVFSRPYQATEAFVWENGVAVDWRSRHSAMWVFDITGDEDAKGELDTPKLLMCTSLGTQSANWGKGFGNASGALGVIRLRGGMSIWDAAKWQDSFAGDAQQLQASGEAFDGLQVLARRTRTDKGYFADPTGLLASNGFYDPAAVVQSSVISAVITAGPTGVPVGFATMGYTEGLLMMIESRVSTAGRSGESLATFIKGGPKGLDSRLHDLGSAVKNEPASLVETIGGAWQGPNGPEQGNLLLAATTVGTEGHFWALKVDLTDLRNPTATAMGYAVLPGRITRMLADPLHMLVGLEVGGRAWVYDLRTLLATSEAPAQLQPIYDFAVTGSWVLADGMIFEDKVKTDGKQLVITALDKKPQEVALPVSINILPPEATVLAGESLDFTAEVSGTLAGPVRWDLLDANGGTISSTGSYQAPATKGNYQIKATLVSNPSAWAKATVTVAEVALEPQTATLMPGGFLAVRVKGRKPSAKAKFRASVGAITLDGVFIAPAVNGLVTITYEDEGLTATAHITVRRGKGLTIRPRLEIEEAGEYLVQITLRSASGKLLAVTSGFSAGVETVSPEVWFSASSLRSELGEDGPYDVQEVVLIRSERDLTRIVASLRELGQTVRVKLADLGSDQDGGE